MTECTLSTSENQIPVTPDADHAAQLDREIGQLEVGIDLEQVARTSGALKRHRGVHTARDLLRLVLGYSVLDYSLRLLGVWATLTQLATISKTALRQRLRQCCPWLGRLVVLLLAQAQVHLPTGLRVRVKVVDATVITQPGSHGTDWRLHLGFDLGRACLDQVELTDGQGAEGLDRFSFQPEEIVLADKAYALARHLAKALAAGVRLIIRTGWNRLRFEQADGQLFDLVGWLHRQAWAGPDTPREVPVWVTTPQGRFALRLVAQALSPSAAEQARRRVRQAAQKNHHTPDERSLYTAGFILLLSNLPASWSAATLLGLYRFRWQVELAFKRYKSLLHLDGLRAKDPQLAQVYVLGKLMGVLLLERLQGALWMEAPDAFASTQRPLSFWRLTRLAWETVQDQVRGPLKVSQILTQFPQLVRYLCDEPRSRTQQLAQARALLAQLGAA